MQELLTLKYDGSDAGVGEMDAADVAAAINGFATFAEILSKAAYGKDAKVQVRIKAFDRASLDINTILEIATEENLAIASTLFGQIIDFLKLAKECIALLKHLNGEPPKSVRSARDKGLIVENNNGQIFVADQITFNVALNPSVGRATEKFVKRPLNKSATTLQLSANDNIIATITSDDAPYFIPINTSEVLSENITEEWLTVRTVKFDEQGKWKFFNGRNAIPALIEDHRYLERVEAGDQVFASGDALFVRLRSTQKRMNGRLRVEYTIEEVLDHRRGPDPGQFRF